MMAAKYPNIKVQLAGEDGNAFAIMARVSKALRRSGVGTKEVEEYFAEATSGDYDHLLRTTMEWVECFNDPEED